MPDRAKPDTPCPRCGRTGLRRVRRNLVDRLLFRRRAYWCSFCERRVALGGERLEPLATPRRRRRWWRKREPKFALGLLLAAVTLWVLFVLLAPPVARKPVLRRIKPRPSSLVHN